MLAANSGEIVHQDTDCLKDYIDPMTMTIEEAMASD